MQSETADFAPCAATWRTGRQRRLLFWPIRSITRKHGVINETGSI